MHWLLWLYHQSIFFHRPLLLYIVTFILTWISNHILNKVCWNYLSLPKLFTVEVCKWIINFILHFIMDIINYLTGILGVEWKGNSRIKSLWIRCNPSANQAGFKLENANMLSNQKPYLIIKWHIWLWPMLGLEDQFLMIRLWPWRRFFKLKYLIEGTFMQCIPANDE